MTISLDAFLRTGNLGDLRHGMSKDEVRAVPILVAAALRANPPGLAHGFAE